MNHNVIYLSYFCILQIFKQINSCIEHIDMVKSFYQMSGNGGGNRLSHLQVFIYYIAIIQFKYQM